MSSEIDYFPRGLTTTPSSTKSVQKTKTNVDRNDLFISTTANKRKRSTNDKKKFQEEQNKKKKKSIDGEDLKENLYRRLHKKVNFFILSMMTKSLNKLYFRI